MKMKRSSDDILKNLIKNAESELADDIEISNSYDKKEKRSNGNTYKEATETDNIQNMDNLKNRDEYKELEGTVDYSNLNISKFNVEDYCIKENFSTTAEMEANSATFIAFLQ